MELLDELLEIDRPYPATPAEKETEDADEAERDDNFSYEGYQVVRGEFFTHYYEPVLTFSKSKVFANKACLRKMPEVEYVQFLVNSEEKKLVIRPSAEDEKDSFAWYRINGTEIMPRQIICRVFFAKIINLMGWNPDYRYKLLGKIIRSGEEKLMVFDMKAPEIFIRYTNEEKKIKSARRPLFPAEWENQFGVPFEEHKKLLQINIFDGYTVFGIQNNMKQEIKRDEWIG